MNQLQPHPRWEKPSIGWVKANVDAAIFRESGTIGLGCVIRGDVGEFIAARSERRHQCLGPAEAEAMGVREALSWIKQ